jgi:RHS repeat-associated protein
MSACAIAETRTTTYTYDEYGNVSTVTDPLERTTGTEYDLLGRTTAVVDALNHTNSFQYNAWGSLTNLVDANGNHTGFEYDTAGRLTKKTYDDPAGGGAGGTFHQYFYDDLGRLETAIDAKNQMITYQYDLLGQLRTNCFYGATNAVEPEKTIVYTYDDYGRILTSTLETDPSTGSGQASTNIYTFTYDDSNRTRTVTVDFGPFSKTYTYQYDSNSRKSAFIRGSVTNSYTYDAQGRLESISIPDEGVITYSYNAAGLPESITLPGGTEKLFGYDALSALATNTVKDTADNTVMSREYIRNAVQNITGIGEADPGSPLTVKSYQYDLTDQLTNETVSADGGSSSTSTAFSYDPMGNRLLSHESAQGTQKETAYEPNSLNQYEVTISTNLTTSTVSTNMFSYDLNGNTTQKVSVASGSTSIVSYAYSVDNRLTAVESNVEGQKSKAEYSYDPFGRRISKEIYEWDDTQSQWSKVQSLFFLYADEGLVGEFDNSGNEIRSYVWKPGSLWMNDPVCMTMLPQAPSSQPQTFYYLNDHLGAPQRMVDGSGALVWSMTSEAFGKATVASRSTIVNNLRFSSQYYDDETGLHYNYFRYYDAEAGRYLRRDPIKEERGRPYVFVSNNPISHYDLLGLKRDCDAEHIACFRRCYGGCEVDDHGDKGSRYRLCQAKCLAEYMAGEAANTADELRQWIIDHPQAIIGTIVVIGGVVYIVATGGLGSLILVPMLV